MRSFAKQWFSQMMIVFTMRVYPLSVVDVWKSVLKCVVFAYHLSNPADDVVYEIAIRNKIIRIYDTVNQTDSKTINLGHLWLYILICEACV